MLALVDTLFVRASSRLTRTKAMRNKTHIESNLLSIITSIIDFSLDCLRPLTTGARRKLELSLHSVGLFLGAPGLCKDNLVIGVDDTLVGDTWDAALVALASEIFVLLDNGAIDLLVVIGEPHKRRWLNPIIGGGRWLHEKKARPPRLCGRPQRLWGAYRWHESSCRPCHTRRA